MATSKCYYRRPSHRFISGQQTSTTGSEFELDEWDIYSQGRPSSEPPDLGLTDIISTVGRTGVNGNRFPSDAIVGTAPVNVPDWSTILGEESRRRRVAGSYEEGDGRDDVSGGGGGRWLPPHELLARRRMASFSVHEGSGRTLKGRDLSRVRNAIFEITGFQD
ncbi:PREDICTED: uncharacterized protein LOC104826363 [Tarenaya hassleriana]|uniref:uncharacterized protein LOC104826363 n=1 Tax=Tarenaya hassleriana TaxID=28532 RepID=UPI00053CA0EF|nr:PREDICTED: uncharacterized protein LOC104826363 [Tarenaya hassleriana]